MQSAESRSLAVISCLSGSGCGLAASWYLVSGAIADKRTAAATVVCGILFLLAAGFGTFSRKPAILFAVSAASILAVIEVTVAAVVESGAGSWLMILCAQAAALLLGVVVGRMATNLRKKEADPDRQRTTRGI